MKRLLLLLLFMTAQISVFAQWKLTDVPDSLKEGDAIIRRYATDVKILDNDKINVAEDIVITVINRDIIGTLFFKLMVKGTNSLSIRLYDEEGRKIRVKSRKFDYFETNAIENNLRYFNDIPEITFPFTVEFEYKKTMLGFDDLNSWWPTATPRISVQNASLRVRCLDTAKVQLKYNKIQLISNSVDEEGYFVSLWELNGFKVGKKGNRLELDQSILPFITLNKRKN